MSARSIAEYEASLASADGIVVPCEFVKQGVVDLGIPEAAVTIVPFGSRRRGLGPGGPRHSSEPSSPIRLLWVGQPLFRKGFHDFLAAYACLPTGAADLTIVFPSAKCLIPVGALPPRARVLVKLTPAELAHEFNSHDLLVMPSLVEGFGMVYLEALSFGMPVVCTPNTGVADLITDGREGFIVEAGDYLAVADCILRLSDDRELLSRMKFAAAQAGAFWTWDRFRTQLLSSIEQFET